MKWTTWVCTVFVTSFANSAFPDIFYTGLPKKNFPDFKRLVDYVLSELLDKIADVEATDLDMIQSKVALLRAKYDK